MSIGIQSQHHLGKFELYLFDLLHHHASEITKADKKLCQKLMDILEQYGFHPLYPEDMDNTSRDRVAKVSFFIPFHTALFLGGGGKPQEITAGLSH